MKKWSTLYALSKTGSIRVYEIIVEDKGDSAIMTTRKKVTLNGKWTEDSYEYKNGVNIGKSNETSYLEQAINEAESAYKRQLDAGFTEEMPSTESKYNTDANGNIKPMLAISFNKKKIKFPCIVQPKLDGVRCLALLVNDKVKLISRKGKEYTIPHIIDYFEEHKELLPLDGELYNHQELTFQEIVSAVKRQTDLTVQIRYAVYDKPLLDVPNEQRWGKLVDDYSKIVTKYSPTYLVDSIICNNFDEIMEYHNKCVSEGYEGVIIRNLDGIYEFGFRSNDLIKYKEFVDDEFQIADVIEATGRDKETAIFVLYKHGCEGKEITDENTFKAKPKGSYNLRKGYLMNKDNLIGLKATIKYQGLTDDGTPRFPSAIAIRDYE